MSDYSEKFRQHPGALQKLFMVSGEPRAHELLLGQHSVIKRYYLVDQACKAGVLI
jgi:hypothetical protein